MLVLDGKLHPLFMRAEASKKYRDGVGVKADGKSIVFAISDDEVSFASFARLYRDVLKCPNALFLDGSGDRARYLLTSDSDMRHRRVKPELHDASSK